MVAARRPDRAVGVPRCHPVEGELRDAAIDLLGDLKGKLRSASRLDRVMIGRVESVSQSPSGSSSEGTHGSPRSIFSAKTKTRLSQ
ncbi:MAG TPA: hypothetical protein VF195_04685 [Actinomycetota bacterium]